MIRREAISRLRNTLKLVKEDPFVTDRFLFSLIMKYGRMLIARQANEGKIYSHRGLFQFISCLPLIELDKVPECCIGIKTGCKIRRTEQPLPDILQGKDGPIIRTVASLDLSDELSETSPAHYATLTRLSTHKYNKTGYFWFLDGHIYVPNRDWEGVYIEALFSDTVAPFKCEEGDECMPAQDMDLNIPDYLFAEIEQMVEQELVPTVKLPSDGADDSQNVFR